MLNTLRGRLIVSYLLVAVGSAIAVGAVSLALIAVYNTRAEREYLNANALRVAENLLPMFGPQGEGGRPEQFAATARLYSFLGQVRVTIRNKHGVVLADSGSPSPGGSVAFYPPAEGAQPARGQPPVNMVLLPENRPGTPQPVPPQGAPASQPEYVNLAPGLWGGFAFTDVPPEQRARSGERVAVPVLWPDDHRVIGFVELSEGPAYGQVVVEGIRWALLGGVLAGALLAVAAGIYTARQLTRPLDTLRLAAERMAAGDLQARAPAGGGDEFGRLSAQFNRMAGQLQSSFAALAADREALRRFVADAAHALRTPLTAAMTFIELLRDNPEPAQQALFLEQAYAQLERLSRTVQQLLDLSLLDAGVARIAPVPGDLRAAAESALAGVLPLALEKGVSLESALAAEPVAASFDESFLRQALDNLLANAIRFTPKGGKVTIGAVAEGGRAQLWVADTGPGIPPEDLPHVFERFYRGRSVARAEGSGLGLAIAHSIVAAHGGALAVESEPGTGARFTITLPGAGTAPAV